MHAGLLDLSLPGTLFERLAALRDRKLKDALTTSETVLRLARGRD